MPALCEALGYPLPPMNELNTEAGIEYLQNLLYRHSIPMPHPSTASKLMDKLIEHFITDKIVEPTFVMDHPLFMSPLAKGHADGSGLAERFELFINKSELCNAYSELAGPCRTAAAV